MAGPGPVSPAEAELRRQLDSILDEAQRLRGDVHSAELARKRATKINMVVLAVLAGFVAMLFAIGYQNNQVLGQVQQTNNRVADCTTAGGECYEDGRQRTGEAISALTRISIYVSQCGRLYPGESGPAFDAKMERCVMDRLAKAQTSATPSTSPAPSPSPGR